MDAVEAFIRRERVVASAVGTISAMHLITVTRVQASDVDEASRHYKYKVVGTRGSATVTAVAKTKGINPAGHEMSIRFVQ